MTVQNGQLANQTTFNEAFLSRLNDSDTVGLIDLINGGFTNIINLQRALNDIMDSIGAAHQAATDATSNTYATNNQVTDGDSYKEALEAIDAFLEPNSLKGSLLTFVDDTAFETALGRSGQAGDIYYNTTDDKIRFYDDSIPAWSDLGGVINMEREVPAGSVDGVNTSFTLSLLPLSDEHVSVYVDGRMLNDSEVSISAQNITLTEAPQLGQDIFAWYVHEGIVSAITPVPGTRNVEYITIDLAQEAAKEVTLANSPDTSSKVILDVVGGTSQHFGVDYTVSGTTLSWNGLGLDGILAENDVLRIIYDS